MQAKTVYTYDLKSFDYLGARLEPDEYELVSGETLIVPPPNLTKRKFDVAAQKWTGEKVIPASTLEQKLLMQQSQQLTLMQATAAQQETQIKQLQQMFMMSNQQQAVEKSKEVTAQ